jgi:DNA-binding SARP family transcriptional activator/WD40 repeat protein/tRNA A-37 threonylcarbamoyl transferase component Bud32
MRFTVLRGAVGVSTDGGDTIALGGSQQRRLLAGLLGDHGRVVTADQLVEALWPEGSAPEGARRTVMSYVSRLRTAIGDERLIHTDAGYVLVLDGATYDAAEFEACLSKARDCTPADALHAYDDALALWSGRAFGDDADEWWLRPVAVRLEELRLVALEERADCLIETGRHAEAVAELDALVAEHPLRERFVALSMRALYLGGRHAEALRAYRRYHDYLGEETGLEPSEALTDLERRITIGDPTLAPATGIAVPGYELGEVIGEGAFGAVYRALQPSVGREVAIKVVRRELADEPRFVQRFEAEAQVVARLEHPHVVPLYDFWRQPGGAYLVFRLLRGGSLADLVADGPLPLDRVTRLVGEIGDALGAAHALGVVHRDVKPANVLFDEAGNSYLADFGISVTGDSDDDLDLRSAGSPLYASPEQARDGVATAASDQYSLGIVVWEALTGQVPFGGSTATEVLRAKLGTAVPTVTDRRPDVPDTLNAVLQRATAPHPAERYATTAEFVQAWGAAVVDVAAMRTTGRLSSGPATRTTTQTVATLRVGRTNPYKGLRAFREADAPEFQGRSALVAALVTRVNAEPFVAVVGPSGSGKSSLVHAGLVPALRRDGALVVSMVPGADPLAELEAALRRVATSDDAAALRERLLTSNGFVEAAAELAPDGARLVLVVDQFEELWTLVESERARDRFIDFLARAAEQQEVVRVVVTLRADLYDRPLQHPTLGPIVRDATFAVTPMSASELQEAIVVPAERVGVRFEGGLVATIVDDVVSRAGALPLLQFTLTELYEQRTSATVTATSYAELGGIGGALASRAEQLYDETPDDRQPDVRRLFTQLVTPGDDGDDLRRRATLLELSDVAPDVIDRYRGNRLLVLDHHPITREPTIEVAHEALLREWPRLREWIDEDRDAIRVRRALTQSATEWHEHARDESELYRGTRLAAVDEVAARFPLAAGEREFLAASRELSDRERADAEQRAAHQLRQNRRLRWLLTAAAVLLVVALISATLAFAERGNARDEARHSEQAAIRADVARLVAESQRLRSSKPDLAMLLALEASRLEPGVRTDSAVLGSLLQDSAFVRYEGDPAARLPGEQSSCGSVCTHRDAPAFAPDSKLMAVADAGAATVRIVDARSGEKLRALQVPALEARRKARELLWVRDDLIMIVVGDALLGIDARDGSVQIPIATLPGTATNAAASANGSRLAVASDPGTGRGVVTVFALPSGRRLFDRRVSGDRSSAVVGVGRIPIDVAAAVAWRREELYVGSGAGTIEQWDPDTGTTLRSLGTSFPAVFSMVFAPDGDQLVVSGHRGEADYTMSYDPLSGNPRWVAPQAVIGRLTFDSRHGAVLVANSYDAPTALRSYEVKTGKQLDRQYVLGTSSICESRVSADAEFLAVVPCQTQGLGIWSLSGAGALMRRLGPADAVVGPLPEAYAPDGSQLLLAEPNRLIAVDRRTGAVAPVVGNYLLASYLEDGRVVVGTRDSRVGLSTEAVADVTKPFAMRIRNDVRGDKVIAALSIVDWHAAKSRGAAGSSDGYAGVYDFDGNTLMTVKHSNGPIWGLALNKEADRLFVGGFRNVLIAYDVATGDEIAELGPGASLAIDRARALLAVSALDGTISLYDAGTMRPTGKAIARTSSFAYQLQFTPDGRTLVTGHANGEIGLYDVATRTVLGVPFRRPILGPFALAPDSRALAIVLEGGVAELTLDPAIWKSSACHAAGRNLSREEWDLYLGGEPRATCAGWPAA